MWMTHKRKTTGALAALGMVLTMAACSGGPAPAESAIKDTVKIGIAQLPTTFDPGQNFLRTDLGIANLIAGTLTTQNRDGKGVSMGLAESIEPSGDLRYVVKLKSGLKFSDGSALTSADVVASFDHYMGDKTNGYAYMLDRIKSVTADGDLTINFDLSQPYPTFSLNAQHPSWAILPSEVIQSRGDNLYKGDPLPTSGPFQVKTSSPNELTLTANPNFAGDQRSTKTVVFEKIPDPAARLAQVQGGQIDFSDQVSPKVASQLAAPVQAGTTRSVSGVYYMLLNNRDNSLLKDARIRQAVAVAIDRGQINSVAFAGRNQPTLGLWATESKYNAPFLPKTPDTSRAKDLLTGTACATGCKLRLVVASDDELRNDMAVITQQNLKAIGIEVDIQKAEISTVLKRMNDGDFDLVPSFTYNSADEPDAYLSYLLGESSNALYTGYKSSEMGRLLEDVHVTSGSKLDDTVNQVNALFEKDVPMAPLADYSVTFATRIPADNFTIDPTLYYHVG